MGTKMIQPTDKGAQIGKLTVQQRAFVEALLNDPKFKPSDAARAAGYKSPNQTAYKLMNDRKVAAYLGKQIHLRSQRTQVTADEVIRALANIAFFDIRKIFEEDGTFKAIVDMDEDTAAAIESVESTTRTDQYGNSTTTTKLKFHSKMSALDILARHLGMLDSRLKVEHTGSVDIIGQILSKVESEKSNVIDSDAIRLEAEKT